MNDTPKLREIDVKLIGSADRNGENSHPDIDDRKSYLVKIHGHWNAGKFTEQWYGWHFHGYGKGGGIALGPMFEEIYEIEE